MIRVVLNLLCVPVFFTACIATTGDIENIHKDQGRLERELLALHQRQMEDSAALEMRIVSIEGRAQSLESTLLNLRKTGAESGVNTEHLLNELARLRGEIEELRTAQATLHISTQQGVANQKNSSPSLSADELYKNAHAAFSRADYEEAIQTFQILVKNLEQDSPQWIESHRYIGDANRELSLKVKEQEEKNRVLKSAIYAYQKVLDARSSPEVPAALFGIGQCFESLNLSRDAKVFYEEIVSQHRNSPFAAEAKQRLAAIR
jgi:TolA-binding protein